MQFQRVLNASIENQRSGQSQSSLSTRHRKFLNRFLFFFLAVRTLDVVLVALLLLLLLLLSDWHLLNNLFALETDIDLLHFCGRISWAFVQLEDGRRPDQVCLADLDGRLVAVRQRATQRLSLRVSVHSAQSVGTSQSDPEKCWVIVMGCSKQT